MKELLIAALGPALVLFISEVFRWFHAKKEQEERFFYEVYPKRLELYEEIVGETSNIGNEELPLGCTSARELSDFYKGRCDALAALGWRCSLYGSPRVASALTSLVVVLAEGSKIALSLPHPLHSEAKHDFISTLVPGAVAIKLKIIEFIREESGAYIVDNKAANFLRNPKKNKHVHKNVN
ncbi:MAG: hypothetical protein LBU16_10405 [Treponema sp.]|nr:hypothetical protein [Treponema sp.]